jgi:glycosyltransferase involved in cell wall biosynthesis
LYTFPALAGYWLARLYRKPFGLWPHGVLAPFQRTVSRYKKAVYNLLAARQILEKVNVLFYSTHGEREEARSLRLKTPSVIVPHGIDTTEYRQLPLRGLFRRQYLDGDIGPLILYLGRINAKKGLDLLVEAMRIIVARLPEVWLAIVGGGDPPSFMDQVKNWIKSRGLEQHVVMTDFLPNSVKLTAFADADVFVLPSQAENFGFAMLEAMASRVPVVITDTLNYADEVRRHKAGLVVRHDPQEFATAILGLLMGMKPSVSP